MKKFPLFAVAIFCMDHTTLMAQVPAAPVVAAPANLITNGGFERSSSQDNLWDGVDSEGNLAGGRISIEALAESGSFRAMAMPLSVSAGDLNGDGLIDILAADPLGYMRVYFNSGTKNAPAFTHAEAVPVFISAAPGDRQRALRVNLYDWSRRGVLDICAGNYFGEFFFLQNTGSATAPDFRQPPDLGKAVIPTSKSGELWANLIAPAAYDFNKDGRVDVAVGEGSYSANSVHLLLNQGSNSAPKFDEEHRFYLAYGDGREHLTPTVVDYNGDGEPDIIASNREGRVGVYLNPGPLWKAGLEFKFSNDIKFGAVEVLGGIVTIFAADFNGDNLFDLLIGKANGRIALALNEGTKTEPKFNAPVDLKGKDIWSRNILNPSGWQVDVGLKRGNTYAAASVVTAEIEEKLAPPEGTAALKMGYFPSPNKIFKVPALVIPGSSDNQKRTANMEATTENLSSNIFLMRKDLSQLKIGSTYEFSLKAKGVSATAITWKLEWRVTKEIAPVKLSAAGDRKGAVSTQRFVVSEGKEFTGNISAGAGWSTMSKMITVDKLKDKNLQDVTTTSALIEIRGSITPNVGAVYFDDFQLIEKIK